MYSWFYGVYCVSYATGLAGYALVMADFLGVRELLPLPDASSGFAGVCLMYGLYYGVLGRDCAEMCADRMSATFGYSKKDDDNSIFFEIS